jgi:exonuclease VII large subunit
VAEKLRRVASRAMELAEAARRAADDVRRGHEKAIETASALERRVEDERHLAEDLRRQSEGLRESEELARQRNEAHRVRAELRRAASENAREFREDVRRRLGPGESKRERAEAAIANDDDEISPALRRAIREEVARALELSRAGEDAAREEALPTNATRR